MALTLLLRETNMRDNDNDNDNGDFQSSCSCNDENFKPKSAARFVSAVNLFTKKSAICNLLLYFNLRLSILRKLPLLLHCHRGSCRVVGFNFSKIIPKIPASL